MTGLRIGPLLLPTRVVLAPMAGITDVAFRRLVHGSGALLTSEMVTARGLADGDRRSWAYVDLPAELGPRSLQLFGSDPAVVGAAVAELVGRDLVDHVDLNLGCPVPKVTRRGGGAALPVRRRLLRAVLRAAVAAAGPRVPVTVKARVGLDDARHTHLDTGAIAAEEGIAAVALHARTVAQGYGGAAAWERIAELRALLPPAVTVLGNGDLWTAQDGLDMVARTGCDGVVVGRGCLGRPWLLGDLARALAGRPVEGPPPFAGTARWAARHLDLLLAAHGCLLDRAAADTPLGGEAAAHEAVVRRFRKHLRWYLEGYDDVPATLPARAGQVTTRAEVAAVLAAVPPTSRVAPASLRRPRGKAAPGRVALPHGWWEQRDAPTVVDDPVLVPSGG